MCFTGLRWTRTDDERFGAGGRSPETTEMPSVFVVIFLFSQQHRRGSLQPERHGVPRGRGTRRSRYLWGNQYGDASLWPGFISLTFSVCDKCGCLHGGGGAQTGPFQRFSPDREWLLRRSATFGGGFLLVQAMSGWTAESIALRKGQR